MRISDWSSDVCSSDLGAAEHRGIVYGRSNHCPPGGAGGRGCGARRRSGSAARQPIAAMKRARLTMEQRDASQRPMKKRLLLPPVAAAVLLSGCVQVRAPDKPIEINLNVNIRQEVIVRLEKDGPDLIQSNPGVF